MFLLRIRPLYLFLLMMLPAISAAILQQAPSFTSENVLRMQILGVNLSTFFAVVITSWIITLTVVLAPGKTSRALIIAGICGATVFRAWQDSWAIDELHMSGKIPAVEDLELLSPLFILHALSSVMMLLTLTLLSVWLVRKEKSANIKSNPLWLTIIQFLFFPIGLFWIHKRVLAICPPDEMKTNAE